MKKGIQVSRNQSTARKKNYVSIILSLGRLIKISIRVVNASRPLNGLLMKTAKRQYETRIRGFTVLVYEVKIRLLNKKIVVLLHRNYVIVDVVHELQ
jgi:hypothetical protein